MSVFLLILAAFFLPLFPATMLFTRLAVSTQPLPVRLALVVFWPQIGVVLILWGELEPGPILATWAVMSALFYAFRMLTVREVGRWNAMLAVSAWPLVWLYALQTPAPVDLVAVTLALTTAPVLMLVVHEALVGRLGAAYTGLHGGLARDLPRLSGIIVVATLAAMALPLFPGFFALLTLLGSAPVGFAIGILLIWLLWSWAGARLLQGTVFGPRSGPVAADLTAPRAWGFAGLVVALTGAGLIWTGGAL
ncbi:MULTISPECIES: hypothetical protein [unclassified Thioalkalivibrio]|uniref:hypothetical protein n=1 Tax=unclassified Thioalkalivibrio TaxID=2621013 RepID=UPI0003A526DE|nr:MULTISPECIES: hypothetical protein [unclassified Thioalkalivibrio]